MFVVLMTVSRSTEGCSEGSYVGFVRGSASMFVRTRDGGSGLTAIMMCSFLGVGIEGCVQAIKESLQCPAVPVRRGKWLEHSKPRTRRAMRGRACEGRRPPFRAYPDPSWP